MAQLLNITLSRKHATQVDMALSIALKNYLFTDDEENEIKRIIKDIRKELQNGHNIT